MSFAERLKKARTDKGMSQVELAEKFGVRGQQIWRYENGRSLPDSLARIEQLAQILEVDTQWLIGYNASSSSEFITDAEVDLLRLLRAGRFIEAIDLISDLALGKYGKR